MATDDGSNKPVPPDPHFVARIVRLEKRVHALEQGATSASFNDELKWRHQRDRMRMYYALLLFLILVIGAILIGRQQELRYRLEREELSARAAATRPPPPDGPVAQRNGAPAPDSSAGPVSVPTGKAVTGPLTPHQIIERYIDLHAERPNKPGADFTLSVNGAVDLVKSLGNVGMIGAEAAGNLVKKLQDEGIAVGAYTLKKLVDAALEPAPASGKPAAGASTQHVLVNIYTRGQPVVSYGPAPAPAPVTPPRQVKPPKDKEPKERPSKDKPAAGSPPKTPLACIPTSEACAAVQARPAAPDP
ncbi:hypothetical protein ACFFTM_12625 [Pseudoduganella plicata]|uniref:Uncharacterized protein n=1 Tax=Pseudoduganella plicata TaxID=321984 RepID=A0A4P7BCC5_9BURK|nr:hypothetical protein [Pseudoduganella plicata]QBQ35753.1 hypothetical protein E1742_05950 [Pseudoduganella plicata]GGY95366.1 hypothetical protein GCM10007388_30910 [Pseudoduganella plicata]